MPDDGPAPLASDGIAPVDPDFHRLIFQHHPLPAWIYDAETLMFLAVNSAAIREYGYSEREFLSMPVSAIGVVSGPLRLLDSLSDPIDSQDAAWRLRRKNGAFTAVTAYSHDLTFRGRQARLVLINDLSERKRLEQDLRLAAAAVAGASESVMITDAHAKLNIVFVNGAFTSMTGFTAEEVIGRSPAILHGPKTHVISSERIRSDLEYSGAASYQTTNYRKDGKEYIVEWQVSPLRDDSGTVTHYLSLQRDVTDRIRLQEQFQQAQKMEAIGRLAGGIAHDFNNLLTIILGYAGLLAIDLSKQRSPDDKQIRGLNEIQRAAEKAATLTGQLLAFSRKQVLRPRVIDLTPVVSRMEGMLRRLIGEDIDLEIVLEPNLGGVKADPGQIEHVLMNLAANARDAMPNGGMLTIQTRNVEITSRYAPVTSLEAGQYVLLSVSDSGQGMDEETRSKVFEPFFTTKEPGRGTGLGLSMVYGFVKQSGGSVTVTSELGRGACFNVYLPRTDLMAENQDEPAAMLPSRGSGVILAVEDEVGIRRLMREVLAGAGYEVFTAANAQEAIALATTRDGPIDLLLTDVVLPGTSGPELADRLKTSRPDMKVLFASGYSDHALLRQGAISRGAVFVQKPFDTDTLLGVIQGLMDATSSNTTASR